MIAWLHPDRCLARAIWKGDTDGAWQAIRAGRPIDPNERGRCGRRSGRVPGTTGDMVALTEAQFYDVGKACSDGRDPLAVVLNAFEAALATGAESLALAIWESWADEPDIHLLGRRAQGNSSLLFAAQLGSEDFLAKLARTMPHHAGAWALVGESDGWSAHRIIESRWGKQGWARVVEAGMEQVVGQGAETGRPRSRM